MVLAVGTFIVSKYAKPGGSAAAGGAIDFGLNIPPTSSVGGGDTLIPPNMAQLNISPTGELLPPTGEDFGLPGVPGGLAGPAYPGSPVDGRPFWDLSTLPGGAPSSGGFRFDIAKIVNVSLPKQIAGGENFTITVTIQNVSVKQNTFRINTEIAGLGVAARGDKKEVPGGTRDIFELKFTAPQTLPTVPVNGLVELQVMTPPESDTGNTIDKESFAIPTTVVPNPPPAPPPTPPVPTVPDPVTGQPIPVPPPVSTPPLLPPIPPVPIPPVLQLVPVTITRGIDGGYQAIIIEASNLEPSEPTTVFVYLSQKPFQQRPEGGNWDPIRYAEWQQRRNQAVTSQQTPAGSVTVTQPTAAAASYAYSYPASVVGVTTNGNGLRTTQSNRDICSQRFGGKCDSECRGGLHTGTCQECMRFCGPPSGLPPTPGPVVGPYQPVPPAIALRICRERYNGSCNRECQNGNSAQCQDCRKYCNPMPIPPPPVPVPVPQGPIFKRQKVTVVSSPDGTVKHIVRITRATITDKLYGFVLVHGHRSKRHSGRKPFAL